MVEYAAGIGRDLMGEYVEHVSGGIDTFSIRQPLGVVAGICPFNFPGAPPQLLGQHAVCEAWIQCSA